MTIVVMAAELEQVKKQLHKLVNVVKITELDPAIFHRARDHAGKGQRDTQPAAAR